MKFTVVSTNDFKIREAGQKSLVLGLDEAAKQNQGDGDGSNDFSSALTTDIIPSTITMDLMDFHVGWVRHHGLQVILRHDVNPDDVVQAVWGQATLSVEVTCKYGEVLDIAEFEGQCSQYKHRLKMEMARTWSFLEGRGLITTSITSFDRITPVHMKITADVPDSLVDAFTKRAISNEITPARKILEDGLFTDVIITAKNGAEIEGHRSFLSVASPVFKAMFKNKMKESETGQVDMTDVSEQGVRAFLRYAYYGDLQLPKEDIEVASELMESGHKYEMPDLESEMFRRLMNWNKEVFNVKVAWKIYLFTRNVDGLVALKTKLVTILKQKLEELRSLEEYKDVFRDTPDVAMDIFMEFGNPT